MQEALAQQQMDAELAEGQFRDLETALRDERKKGKDTHDALSAALLVDYHRPSRLSHLISTIISSHLVSCM